MEGNKEECITEVETFPRKLHVELLKEINLSHYPPNKTHYLAYALQFGLRLPSVTSMKRSEKRNAQKSGAGKAASATGRKQPRQLLGVLRGRFFIPSVFGGQPIKVAAAFARRGPRVEYSKAPTYRKGRVYPPRKPIALPVERVQKVKQAKVAKVRKPIFVTRCP
jgi:hypothetical protein